MKRRIVLGLVAALAGTVVGLFGPARPASAWVVCGGNGVLTTAPGLLFPVLLGVGVPPGAPAPGKDHVVDVLLGGAVAIQPFTMAFPVGGCVHPPAVGPGVGAGALIGYCGYTSGFGTLGGEPFTFVAVGTTLVLTGHMAGVLNAVPAPGTGSCVHVATPTVPVFPLPGGAGDFVVSGAAVGFNCVNPLPAALTTEDVVDSDTSVGGPLIGVHASFEFFVWTSTGCIGSPLL